MSALQRAVPESGSLGERFVACKDIPPTWFVGEFAAMIVKVPVVRDDCNDRRSQRLCFLEMPGADSRINRALPRWRTRSRRMGYVFIEVRPHRINSKAQRRSTSLPGSSCEPL